LEARLQLLAADGQAAGAPNLGRPMRGRTPIGKVHGRLSETGRWCRRRSGAQPRHPGPVDFHHEMGEPPQLLRSHSGARSGRDLFKIDSDGRVHGTARGAQEAGNIATSPAPPPPVLPVERLAAMAVGAGLALARRAEFLGGPSSGGCRFLSRNHDRTVQKVRGRNGDRWSLAARRFTLRSSRPSVGSPEAASDQSASVLSDRSAQPDCWFLVSTWFLPG
jgi:hypothetical protein